MRYLKPSFSELKRNVCSAVPASLMLSSLKTNTYVVFMTLKGHQPFLSTIQKINKINISSNKNTCVNHLQLQKQNNNNKKKRIQDFIIYKAKTSEFLEFLSEWVHKRERLF